MACDLESVAEAPCGLVYNSRRVQLQSLLLLLAAALNAIDGAFEVDWSAILTATEETGLTCSQIGPNAAKSAQIVCDGLDVDCEVFNCYQESELVAMQTYLTCRLVDEINP